MKNRAMEFLYAALESFPLLYDRRTWKAKHFVELAIDEVQELLDRLVLCEVTDYKLEQRQKRTPPHSDVVLVVETESMQRAQLREMPFLYTEKAIPELKGETK